MYTHTLCAAAPTVSPVYWRVVTPGANVLSDALSGCAAIGGRLATYEGVDVAAVDAVLKVCVTVCVCARARARACACRV